MASAGKGAAVALLAIAVCVALAAAAEPGAHRADSHPDPAAGPRDTSSAGGSTADTSRAAGQANAGPPGAGEMCPAPAPPAWVPVETGGDEGESVLRCRQRLGPGRVDARIPLDQRYLLTTFGGPGDEQPVDCRDPRGADGKWYYAANLQRFSCGQKVRIVDAAARRRCVVVEVADTGPHVCVERAGHLPAWDVSPLVALHLFGVRSTGWKAGRGVYGAPVDGSNAVGPCDEQLADPALFSRGSVGGACQDARECAYTDAVCLAAADGWPGGYCSLPCSGTCPNRAGPHSLAVCSRLADGSASCLARCDFTLYESGCRAGYACGSAADAAAGAQTQVCVPSRCPQP